MGESDVISAINEISEADVLDSVLEELSNNATNQTLHGHDAHGLGPTSVFFIFTACAIGALVRTVLKKIPNLPYTVVLLAVGLALGAINNNTVRQFTAIADMDPHTLLTVFLPVLIFESAYAMEAHTFVKSILQITILAIPGLCVASALTALFCDNVFKYNNWTFEVSMLFGCIISATDPVAVVALLKELGASKQLAIMLEGESLLNDGAAIVLFKLFRELATPDNEFGGHDIGTLFALVIIVGPLVGIIMAWLTNLWLVNIFNDALTEITITLASTYMTYYIGEYFASASGVLAVVVLGVILSNNKTSVSPEVETFLHRFWEMLAYLANTLIFIIVGVVITQKATKNIDGYDLVLNLSLFVILIVIRLVVIAAFSPVLSRLGYGLPWKNSTVMVWGGLRGAVGLALALNLAQYRELDPSMAIQNKILFHTAGIVLLTLLINATTIKPLLQILGMSEISIPKRMAMASAVRNLQSLASSHVNMYKTDRFLADADWDIVTRYVTIDDPYKTLDEEAEMDALTSFERTSKCPTCETDVPNEPSQKEWFEMRHEARLRLLKAEKISYWKQFEHGMLSREAVRKLTELVDVAADVEDGYVDCEEIRKSWKIEGFFAYARKKLELWQSGKLDMLYTIPRPKNKCMRAMYKMCTHTAFEVVIYTIIFSNVVAIIIQMVYESRYCDEMFDEKFGITFDLINYVSFVIYMLEALFKILAFRKWYFRSKWNWFDVVILVASSIDIALDLTVLKDGTFPCDEDISGQARIAGSSINLNILKFVKGFRFVRLLRSLRLIKGLIPQMMDVVNLQINKKLRFGYDVGTGYVMGEEEVQKFIDHMIDNDKIADEMKHKMTASRLKIIRELGLLQKVHPGVAVSIKTQQAARRILNTMRDGIIQMRSEGVLDDAESQKLEVVVEMRMKRLLKIPPTINPPPPERIIGNLSWVREDLTLIEYIKHNAALVTMQDGEKLNAESDPRGGIYVIISGLVKVDKYIEDTHASKKNKKIRPVYQYNPEFKSLQEAKESDLMKVTDYLTTGSVLGEMSLLTHKPSSVIVTCETSVQLYHIPYDAIQAALELFTDEPSLEYRLWRVCAIRVATVILRNQPLYITWTQDKMKMYLEKCILFIKKTELPEGGRFVEFPTFDINPTYMSEIILIHGEAENVSNGDRFVGPCYVPTKVERLVLIPGKTDKHVIIILPRETEGVVLERNKSGSTINVRRDTTSLSGMCLNHASKQRIALTNRISEIKASHSGIAEKMGHSITNMTERVSEHGLADNKRITKADLHYDSDTCLEVVTENGEQKTRVLPPIPSRPKIPPLPSKPSPVSQPPVSKPAPPPVSKPPPTTVTPQPAPTKPTVTSQPVVTKPTVTPQPVVTKPATTQPTPAPTTKPASTAPVVTPPATQTPVTQQKKEMTPVEDPSDF